MASNDQGGSQDRGPRGRAAEAYQAARERTASAYEAARRSAGDVTRQAGEQLAVYPVAAVIGGFAVGALVAALLPASEREGQLLGKTGRRLTDAAREAAQKGLDAGKSQIEEIRAKAAQKVGEAVVDAVGGKS
jgi:vacuolar-type H+-ATPase subunit H